MTLLNPAAFAFLGLAPVIVLLYLLKLRRQPARVSTLMFWQRVAADHRRRALFQRLRQLLSLLLHLLIFALILLALARPELASFRGTEAGLSTVVVLDARARMQARESAGETRFTQATRVAEGYLRRASTRQPVALIVAGSAPRVAGGLTGDEKTLLDALHAQKPTDAGGRLEDAVDLAGEVLAARAGARRIVVITDRAPAGLPREAELRLVGSPRENVGITRLAARELPNSPETDEVLVEIENFGRQRQAGNVELSFEGRLLDVKPFDLAPGERRADVYPALAARTGLANARGWLLAHLDLAANSGDALALDNDAYAVVPPPRPLHVLLVSRGDWFLENLLKADERIQFDELAPDAFQLPQAAGFDAVICDDVLPAGLENLAALPPGNFLFIRRTPFAPPADQAAPLERPLVTDVDDASPLLRLVNLRDVTFLRAEPLALPAAGEWRFSTPVRSFDHPLVVTAQRPGPAAGKVQRLAALAFGPADSDLPLRIAFPLFIHNAVDWLAGRDAAAEPPSSLRAGETVRLAAGQSLWLRPQRSYGGLEQMSDADVISGPALFQPERNGFYLERFAGGTSRWLGVNTLDPEMSSLDSGPAAGSPASLPVSASPSAAAWWEALRIWPPWVYLAVGAFAICTLEWWAFHRRRTE